MKIKIRDEGKEFNLILPTRLIFSKKVIHLISRVAGKWVPEVVNQIPIELLDTVLDELVRTKKRHGSWELVEIHDADGDMVKITL